MQMYLAFTNAYEMERQRAGTRSLRKEKGSRDGTNRQADGELIHQNRHTIIGRYCDTIDILQHEGWQ